MSRTWRCAVLLACVGAALAAVPALGADASNACGTASLFNPEAGTGGMGGTGATASTGSGGMGGTGASAANGSGGMGGTGTMAEAGQLAPGTGGMGGTGIVGIVTGFASICVNGVEVHYDTRTPVAMNGQPASTRDLAVGQHVVVHAGMVGGQLRAIGIGAIDAVHGAVTGVDPGARAIQVLGQTVRMENALGPDIASIKAGTAVRVSGLRMADGAIMASRIDAATSPAQGSLLGTVSSIADNVAVVNGTRVTLPASPSGRTLAPGAEVFIAGSWNGSELRASRIELQPIRDIIARTDRAIVEGYVTRQQGNQISVGSIPVRLSNDVRISDGNLRDATVGSTVRVELRRAGDGWIADRMALTRPFRSGGERRSTGQGTSDGRSGSGSGSGRDTGGSSSSDSRSGSGESGASGSGNSGSSGTESSNSGSSNSGSSGSGSSGSGASTSGSSGSGGSTSDSPGGSSGLSGSSGGSGGSGTSGTSGSGGSANSGSTGRSTTGASPAGGGRSGGGTSGGAGRSSGGSGGGGRR